MTHKYHARYRFYDTVGHRVCVQNLHWIESTSPLSVAQIEGAVRKELRLLGWQFTDLEFEGVEAHA